MRWGIIFRDQGFLTLARLTFGTESFDVRTVLCVVRMSCSLSGLYPQLAHLTLPSFVTTTDVFGRCQMFPGSRITPG